MSRLQLLFHIRVSHKPEFTNLETSPYWTRLSLHIEHGGCVLGKLVCDRPHIH